MGIVGITEDKDGLPIIRQAVTHKLVIGRGPNSAGNPTKAPKKLDHIAFMRKNHDGVWVDDVELTDFYKQQAGGAVRSLKIVLFDNDLEKVFKSDYMAWVKRGVWCKGNGEVAERRGTVEELRAKKWPAFVPFTGPCANGGCPFPEEKKCKPMGTLYFSLMDHIKLGSVCKVQTTGKQSIAQIYGALMTLKRMTGDVIMGIPINLFVQPDRALYIENGEARTGSKFVWGLEVTARDFQEMRRQLTDGPREFHQIRQITQGTIIEADEEEETDVAEEVTEEFGYDQEEDSAGHPQSDNPAPAASGAAGEKRQAGSSASRSSDAPAGSAKSQPQQQPLDLEERADALMTQMGMGNRAYRDAQLGKNRDRMKEFVQELEQRKASAEKGAPSSGEKSDPAKAEAEKEEARPRTAKERVRAQQDARTADAKRPTPAQNAEPRKRTEADDFITDEDTREYETPQQPQPGPKSQGGFEF
jgi:hypothetical protein